MSAAKEIASTAIDHIEGLLADLFESGASNNHILLGTLGADNEPIQVQLLITRDPAEFVDEL